MGDELKVIFEKTNDKCTLIGYTTIDKLKLFVDLAVPKEAKATDYPTRDEILKILSEFVPTSSIDVAVLDNMILDLRDKGLVEKRRLAKGTAPESGRDSKLVQLVKKLSGQVDIQDPRKDGDQLKELHLFDNVESGQVVARLYPPVPGRDGVDVFGKVLKSSAGVDKKVSFDPETLKLVDEIGKSYKAVTAQRSGYLSDEGGRLVIKDELVVNGNLDFHTGNIEFVGKVRISGDVRSGFEVKARESIEIGGSVYGGALFTEKGDILVRGSVLGGWKSAVSCAGNFSASIIHEIKAEVKGDIHVSKEIRDSVLRSTGSLRMAAGYLIGGELFVSKGAEVFIVGSEAEVPTQINLCSEIESSAEYGDILKRIADHEKVIVLLELHLGPLVKDHAKLTKLPAKHRTKMEEMLTKLTSVSASLTELMQTRDKLLASASDPSKFRLNIKKTMFPGVKVTAAGVSFETKEALPGPFSLIYVDKEIGFEKREYEPLEPELDAKVKEKKK